MAPPTKISFLRLCIVEHLPSSEPWTGPHPAISICSSPVSVPSLSCSNYPSVAVLNLSKKPAQILPSSSIVPTKPHLRVATTYHSAQVLYYRLLNQAQTWLCGIKFSLYFKTVNISKFYIAHLLKK